MTEAMSESTKQPTDIYGAFLQDLREQDPQILEDEKVREKIRITRDPDATDEKKSAARNDVIESSLRLIPFVIKKLPRTGAPPEELIGQGFEVVNNCIDNWDFDYISPRTEESPKFSSYLVKSLEKNLRGQRTVARVGDFIPTPEHIEGISNLMRKARELFLQEERHEPSQDEWYKRSVKLAGENYSVSMLKLVTIDTFEATQRAKFRGSAKFGRNVSRGNVYTDTLIPARGTVEDTLIDKNEDTEMNAIDNVIKEEIEGRVNRGLESLTSRERTVLELRFGIGLNEEGNPKEPLSLEAVSNIFGVKRERIRQIESKAIRKFRHPSRSIDLRKLYAYFPDDWDKKAEEKMKREGLYRDILTRISDISLTRFSREELVYKLGLIRNGNKSGKIDTELLLDIFYLSEERLELLKTHEKDLSTSPRILAKDILKFINDNIDLMNKGYVNKGNLDRNVQRYWSKHSPIRMEEVIDKSKELNKVFT